VERRSFAALGDPRAPGLVSAFGNSLRHDRGPQYFSALQGAIRWLGIQESPLFAGEPPGKRVRGRFIGTLTERCLGARLPEDVDELQAVLQLTRRYNHQWLSNDVGTGLRHSERGNLMVKLRKASKSSRPVHWVSASVTKPPCNHTGR
jgi:hypothetical protein